MERSLSRFLKSFALTSVLAAALAGAAVADSPVAGRGPINAALIDEVRSYLGSDIVQMSVRNQNLKSVDRTQADIDTLDKEWRAETAGKLKPLISATLSNPLSAYLTRIQAHSNGLFTEIFVMDNKGLNVGQSSISSDYWQGDEDKWQKTYLVGPGAVFIDAPEWDAASKTWRAQLNIAVDDTTTHQVIGAATFEVNLTELQRRR
jgi:hypothetical protein